MRGLLEHLGFNDCVIPECTNPVTLHHIVPRGKGGTNRVENLMPICHYHHTVLHHKVGSAFVQPVVNQVQCELDGCKAEGYAHSARLWRCKHHHYEWVDQRLRAKYGAKFIAKVRPTT